MSVVGGMFRKMAILSVKHVCKSYKTGLIKKITKRILQDITFDVQEGEVLGLTGASGSGKSTLIRCIMRLTPVDSGTVIMDGTDLLQLSPTDLREKRKVLQMLFQNPVSALNPRKTIRESLAEPILIHQLPEATLEEIPDILDMLQLKKNLLNRYPHQLSGGELQRICLGRLLLLRPRLLLLDEPTSMLDVSVQAQIIEILRDIRKEYPITVLFVSHDLSLLKAVCDRIGVMERGKLLELQPVADLFQHPSEQYTRDLIRAFNEF